MRARSNRDARDTVILPAETFNTFFFTVFLAKPRWKAEPVLKTYKLLFMKSYVTLRIRFMKKCENVGTSA